MAALDFEIFEDDEPRVGVVIGTGKSLTPNQVKTAKQVKTFGCNRAFMFNVDVVHGCNYQFWDTYWNDIKRLRCIKWTTRPESAKKYGINYIPEKWEPGLSKDKSYICAHHGTGPQMVNIAYHYGCKKIILIGWDMIFRGKIDNRNYTEQRRFLPEDSITQHHWPRTGPNGELQGLIDEMATIIPADYGIDIVNCSPGSAMDCFRKSTIDNEI